MAQDRETGPGTEGYGGLRPGSDITGATREPGDERTPDGRLPGEPDAGTEPGYGSGPGEQARGERIPGATRTPADARREEALGAAGRERAAQGAPMPDDGLGSPSSGAVGGRTAGGAGSAVTGAGREEALGAAGRERAAQGAPMPDDGLGSPSSGALAGREAGGTESGEPDAWPSAPGDTARTGGGHAGTAEAAEAPLLAHEESERFEERLRQTVAGFVDEPRAAVEEADRELEEIAARFSEAVTRRRRTLRMSWQGEDDRPTESDTERLRLALRDYRELAGRLLHL
ncbi:hypothetical protein [Streptomyces bungoensis]|uniref:hypothetical protein n=1 Tax=Streptomyces bungoensis TaxID=285568 RepID=UPI003416A9B7